MNRGIILKLFTHDKEDISKGFHKIIFIKDGSILKKVNFIKLFIAII